MWWKNDVIHINCTNSLCNEVNNPISVGIEPLILLEFKILNSKMDGTEKMWRRDQSVFERVEIAKRNRETNSVTIIVNVPISLGIVPFRITFGGNILFENRAVKMWALERTLQNFDQTERDTTDKRGGKTKLHIVVDIHHSDNSL
jgi:hypothetical protein